HARKKHHSIAMAVYVTNCFISIIGVADESVRLTASHEPIDGITDIVMVFSFADGAAFHEHRHTGHGRLDHAKMGIFGSVKGVDVAPVAIRALNTGQPLQSLGDSLLILLWYFFCTNLMTWRCIQRRDADYHD